MGCTLLDDGLQEQKLSEKAGQGRDACQGNHRKGHRRGEQGRALVQSGQGGDVFGVRVARDEANDGESGQHGEEVAAEVVEDGGLAGGAQGGDAQQQIAGVGDARIAQQPLEVALGNGAEIAVENRDGGDQEQESRPLGGDVRHGGEQHAQQEDKTRRF